MIEIILMTICCASPPLVGPPQKQELKNNETSIGYSLLTQEPITNNPSYYKKEKMKEFHRPSVVRGLRETCIENEIIDKKEWWILPETCNFDKFLVDLNIVQERFQELKDMPKIRELAQFPNFDVCDENCKFNRNYLITLKKQEEIYPRGKMWYHEAICDTEKAYKAWDELRKVQTTASMIQDRRKAAQELQEIIGKKKFYFGEMIPIVPFWSFKSLN